MKTKLTMMVAMAAACAAPQLTAMPTAEETRRAEPVVKKLLESDRAALASGTKTRSEVAAAAMRRAGAAKTEAEKLLLMKGAFVLYAQDGNLDKAAETMATIKRAFRNLPPQSVTNMMREALAAEKAYGGYTWSYRVNNGGATVAAVSPSPKGAIAIPETLGGVKVTGIGRDLFAFCEEVTSVTIPEGVTSIGQNAFDLCFGLESVTIPSSVKTIGIGAFSACVRLQSVTLPESLEQIGEGGFINCRSLKVVHIPAKLSVIGGAAFAYCTGLTRFTVDAGNAAFTAKDGILYSKDMSTLVSVPNVPTIARMPSTVTKIGVSAFQGRDRLEALTIPESVTIIDHGAFHSCERLGSMTIPASVTKIGPNAFDNCGELTEVTMLGERPEAPEALFPRCGKLKAIHVPVNAKSWAGMKDWFGIPLVFDAK
ncbi:MAG: leucine-rich repeat domain-containing protein [Kiritimatiellae bacterium]|nr:leucine-rich repeat domain-containing protein [Kiritimatiellia bacterium]